MNMGHYDINNKERILMKTYSVMILKADDSPAEIHHIKGNGGPAFDKI